MKLITRPGRPACLETRARSPVDREERLDCAGLALELGAPGQVREAMGVLDPGGDRVPGHGQLPPDATGERKVPASEPRQTLGAARALFEDQRHGPLEPQFAPNRRQIADLGPRRDEQPRAPLRVIAKPQRHGDVAIHVVVVEPSDDATRAITEGEYDALTVLDVADAGA